MLSKAQSKVMNHPSMHADKIHRHLLRMTMLIALRRSIITILEIL
jgi:hypothetical protein